MTVVLIAVMQRVYPRVCGETIARVARPPIDKGLSPRVRGNRVRGASRFAFGGSIPACAGKPAIVAVGILRRGSIPACAGKPEPGTVGERLCRVYPRVCGETNYGQESV